MKKVWEPPRLIAIVRSRPGEAVLTLCKGSPLLLGEFGDDAGCNVDSDNCGVCSANRIS